MVLLLLLLFLWLFRFSFFFVSMICSNLSQNYCARSTLYLTRTQSVYSTHSFIVQNMLMNNRFLFLHDHEFSYSFHLVWRGVLKHSFILRNKRFQYLKQINDIPLHWFRIRNHKWFSISILFSWRRSWLQDRVMDTQETSLQLQRTVQQHRFHLHTNTRTLISWMYTVKYKWSSLTSTNGEKESDEWEVSGKNWK